jgi:cell division protease FtsH
MILLATVLWRMGAANKGDKGTLAMDYSEFMQQVDLKNIASATLYTTPSATEIQGRLRQPSREFKVTVPKEVIPALTERLRNQGAPIEVKARDNAGWLEFVINIAPFALVFGVWVFLVKRRGTKPDQSPPGNLSNRPIG